MAEPLIALAGVRREFAAGDGAVVALRDVDLVIERGAFVAIMGASGSGKSTLMNLLGCLDRPSAGDYRIAGRSTATLEPDELAALRREHFGFVFQRYHLLSELTALGNVEMPAVYAGMAPAERRTRARTLLDRLGMANRAGHHPGQLSGGQQQRVSIARALMNGADVILADEPTGALDRQSGEEVLKILADLNAEGRTVILVTHDAAVAAKARRVVELSDGVIVADRHTADADTAVARAPVKARRGRAAWLDRFGEAARMALRAMAAHRLRTALTMLGIIIGIASVVAVVALGSGAQQKVLADIASLGTNTLEIFPGRSFGDTRSGKIKTLVLSDAEALARQPYVAGATPTVSTSATLRYGDKEASALVNGVGPAYFQVKGTQLSAGRFFDADAARTLAQDLVIDENTRAALFGAVGANPIGKVVLVGKVPATIVGVTKKQQGGFGSSGNLSVFLPYSSVQARILGDTSLRSILVRVADDTDTALAEAAALKLLDLRHGRRDVYVLNTDDIRQTITATTRTLTLLIAAIAVISLVVGGIGVMNIMLVSVSERVREIGVRMAVGARRSDILQQFLTEAVLVCLVGGIAGVALAYGAGALATLFGSPVGFVYSGLSVLVAVTCSTLIGIVFGWLPAKNAATLDPVVALARD
jgi:macrolide transport system ATP-binding/permease protein